MENRLYAMDARALADPALFERRYAEMPPARRSKIDALRFEKDRRLSLAAGLLLKTALERAGAGEEALALGENGKPYLPGGGVEFNLSHSGRLAVCAASERPVGVDVEAYRHFDEKLLRFVYLDDEIAAARASAAPGEEDRAFTELWTRKESFMKYLGTGLALHPRDVRLGVSDAAAGVRFTQYAAAGHALAVCSPDGPFTAGLEWIEAY